MTSKLHCELSREKVQRLEERLTCPGAQPHGASSTVGFTPFCITGGATPTRTKDPLLSPTTAPGEKRVREGRDHDEAAEKSGGSDHTAKKEKHITDYYAATAAGNVPARHSMSTPSPALTLNVRKTEERSTQTAACGERGEESQGLERALVQVDVDARKAFRLVSALKGENAALAEELSRMNTLQEAGRQQAITWLRRLCRLEKAAAREASTRDCARLGTFSWQRLGPQIGEVFEEGNSFRELAAKHQDLQQQRDLIDRERKALRQRSTAKDESKAVDGGAHSEVAFRERHEREDVLRLKSLTLKRLEAALVDERARLEREKQVHIRELKRIRDEVAAHALLPAARADS